MGARAMLAVVAVTVVGGALAGSSVAQSTSRASISSSGIEGDGFSTVASVSADGRFVAFQSVATNLIPVDTNLASDVFVHDFQSGVTERVSTGTSGIQGDGDSGEWAVISADGRFVAFTSTATNMVGNDTNFLIDVFVRDRQTGVTERVSVDSAGGQGDFESYDPSISADGRYVAFLSDATNLVPNDLNMMTDAFVHDRQTGVTTRVSVGAAGQESDGFTFLCRMAPGGGHVVLASTATNMVSGDLNGFADVFVRDLAAGTNWRASVGPGGTESDSDCGDRVSISANGRIVVFESDATNLVANDLNAFRDVFVHDHQTGITRRISVDSAGGEGDDDSGGAAISADGRFVAFHSAAANLVAGDTNDDVDVFVHDLVGGATVRESVSTAGAESNGRSNDPVIAGDGTFLAFVSAGGTLVPGDGNNMVDVFLRHRGVPPGSPFCFGDGSGAACPCGNTSAVGGQAGCLHSLGAAGKLVGSGSPSIAIDTFVLSGSSMPNSSALYFQGTTQLGAGQGTIFGDGLRCAGGSTVRLATKLNAGGASQYPTGAEASVHVKGNCVAGNTRTYQAWYRNAATFCTLSTFNLTNGVQVTWAP